MTLNEPLTVPRIIRIPDHEFYSGTGDQITERVSRVESWLKENCQGFYRVHRTEHLVTVAFYDRSEADTFQTKCQTNRSFAVPFDEPFCVTVSHVSQSHTGRTAWLESVETWTEESCRGRYLISSRYDRFSRTVTATGHFENEVDAVSFLLRWK